MELYDRLQHWEFSIDSAIGDDMLAGVVALRGASPEHKTQVDCCGFVSDGDKTQG